MLMFCSKNVGDHLQDKNHFFDRLFVLLSIRPGGKRGWGGEGDKAQIKANVELYIVGCQGLAWLEGLVPVS